MRLILAMEPLTAKRQGVAVQRVIQLFAATGRSAAPKREERLVDVGPLVVPNTLAARRKSAFREEIRGKPRFVKRSAKIRVS